MKGKPCSHDMKKHNAFFVLVCCVTLTQAAAATAPAGAEWYISNGAGMLLEKTFQTRALRSEYAVSIQTLLPEDTPAELRKYWTPPWRIECRILYEKNERLRTQWVFRDAFSSYLVAVIANDGSGFIEWYDDNGYIVEEQRLDADGSGYFIAYTYRNNHLLKAEAHIVEPRPDAVKKKEDKETEKKDAATQNGKENGAAKDAAVSAEAGKTVEQKDGEAAPHQTAAGGDGAVEEAGTAEVQAAAEAPPPPPVPPKPSAMDLARNPPGPIEFPAGFIAVSGKEGAPLWTDTYRYTRLQNLRAIDREYHNPQAMEKLIRKNFPRFIAGSLSDKNFVSPGKSVATSFLTDVFREDTAKSTYTTDSKRRIVTEVRKNEKDEVIGEMINVWQGDRIAEVIWESPGETRKVEFEYNSSGDRVSEKDYRNGVLERAVTIDKDREIEELYLNGQVALRAIWEKGKKISEERLLNRKIQ